MVATLNIRADSVVKAAKAVAKAKQKIGPDGAAVNAIWNEIERKENTLLRAVERLARMKRFTLGRRDSE